MNLPKLISCQAGLLTHRVTTGSVHTTKPSKPKTIHCSSILNHSMYSVSRGHCPHQLSFEPSGDPLMCPSYPKQEIESPKLQCFIKGDARSQVVAIKIGVYDS